ncbi:trace amine-associated receptor 1-like [Scleropages formosus]|uniref:trace amine-associated receptor 1-like n=1 Tax=Scleropages formosus TaxID=113540 RepID=UPI0010FA8613|nr:trace amine-associated receptor 1-like [Scleropages formosus]
MINQSKTSDTHFCFESSNTSCPKYIYSTAVRASLYVLLGAVIIMTVFGNLLVIITIAQMKQLHTPTNFLVLSLAVADFLLGAMVMPPSMVRSLETCWYLGNVFCRIHSSTDIMLCNASLLNLLLISIDRYYAVCQPLHYHTRVINCVTVTMILTFWSLSAFILFGMMLFEMSTRNAEDIYRNSFHCEGSCSVLQSRMSSVISSVLVFFIPALVIIVLYLKILVIARRQACSIQSRMCANVNLEKNKPSKNKTEHKATRTLAIVVGVYLACWAPWFLCNLISPDVVVASPIFMEMLIWLAYFNSAINPVIYAFSFSWFRKPFNFFLKKIYQF